MDLDNDYANKLIEMMVDFETKLQDSAFIKKMEEEEKIMENLDLESMMGPRVNDALFWAEHLTKERTTMSKKISNFYGTDVYINENEESIVVKHIYEEKNEVCIFDIRTGKLIRGSFSDDERYDDVIEWINDNKVELLQMCRNNNFYEIEGID